MGTWSHEPFGNATANDWAYDLEETKDLALITRVFDGVLELGDEYLEADQACEAVAAAEVLAKILGRGTQTDTYTEKVDEWLQTISEQPSADLLNKAKQVLRRVLAEDSELKELWEESDDAEAWRDNIQTLIARLEV